MLAALHFPLFTALGLEVLVGVTINLDIQYHIHGQVAKASIAPKSGIFLHCLNLCLLLLLPVVFINFTSLHFGLLSAVLTCCLYTIVFLKLVSFIQVQLLQISISLQGYFTHLEMFVTSCLLGELLVPITDIKNVVEREKKIRVQEKRQ